MIDFKKLEYDFGDDWDIFEELVESYLGVYEEYLSNIDQGIKSGDFERVRIESHTLKGIVANFYCDDLKMKAFSLEDCGKKQNLTGATELFNDLKRLNSDVLHQLQSHIQTKKIAS